MPFAPCVGGFVMVVCLTASLFARPPNQNPGRGAWPPVPELRSESDFQIVSPFRVARPWARDDSPWRLLSHL